jgi:adenylosuccinate lyase
MNGSPCRVELIWLGGGKDEAMIERYQDSVMSQIWSRQSELERWHRVEVEWMREVIGDGPANLLFDIGAPEVGQAAAAELSTKHDVVAFLQALDLRIRESADWWLNTTGEPEDAVGPHVVVRQWLHYGLTSSDVADTSLGIALKQATVRLNELANQTLEGLESLFDSPQPSVVARTHGQYAIRMDARHRWGVLYGMLSRAIARCSGAESGIAIGKLSGPVGEGVTLPGPEVPGYVPEHRALRRLGLNTVGSTQLVPRDGLVFWAQCWANAATVCEAIVTQIWLLTQQDVGEIVERPGPDQVGSSAMPHKSNPIRSENIRGLARLARVQVQVLQDSMVQWGEHDLSHSSVERVALPDLCHLVAAILSRTSALLGSIEFRQRTVEYPDSHAELMRLQREGVPYVEAHKQLRATYQRGTIGVEHTPVQEVSE